MYFFQASSKTSTTFRSRISADFFAITSRTHAQRMARDPFRISSRISSTVWYTSTPGSARAERSFTSTSNRSRSVIVASVMRAFFSGFLSLRPSDPLLSGWNHQAEPCFLAPSLRAGDLHMLLAGIHSRYCPDPSEKFAPSGIHKTPRTESHHADRHRRQEWHRRHAHCHLHHTLNDSALRHARPHFHRVGSPLFISAMR